MLGSTGNKCIHRITTTLDLSQLKNKVPQALWHGACGASIGGVPGGRPRCRPRSEFISIESAGQASFVPPTAHSNA